MEPGEPGTLIVHEIYATLQGETTAVGRPCVLVRLTGCPLRCRWCDTTHAYEGGTRQTVDEVVRAVGALGPRLVAVTGGEPLAQQATPQLLATLADAGFTVQLETSGALPIAEIDPRVRRIVDLKAPSSGEVERNLWANVAELRSHDEVKVVLASRADYEWAREVIARFDLPARCTVLLSPIPKDVPPADLAAWILKDGLDVRLQLQLHKILWGPDTRGV